MKIGTRRLVNLHKSKETGVVCHYKDQEELDAYRKKFDLWQHQNKAWKKKYGFNVTKDEFDYFNENRKIIKNIFPILDWFLELDIDKPITGENIHIFGKNYQAIMDALPIKEFINNLQRVNNNLKHCS